MDLFFPLPNPFAIFFHDKPHLEPHQSNIRLSHILDFNPAGLLGITRHC